MTDSDRLRHIAMLVSPWWETAREDLIRIAERLEDLDREADQRDGLLGQK